MLPSPIPSDNPSFSTKLSSFTSISESLDKISRIDNVPTTNSYDKDQFEDDNSIYSPFESISSAVTSVTEELERSTDKHSMEKEDLLQLVGDEVKDEISSAADEQKHEGTAGKSDLSRVEQEVEATESDAGSQIEEEPVSEEEVHDDRPDEPIMNLPLSGIDAKVDSPPASPDNQEQTSQQMNVADVKQTDTLHVPDSCAPLSLTPDPDAVVPLGLGTGQRVLVGNSVEGTVQFIGRTHFAPGMWIGVELEVPRGKNDGSVNGQRYFTCQARHGIFAPPTKIQVLDYEAPSISTTAASEVLEEIEEESQESEELSKDAHSLSPSLEGSPHIASETHTAKSSELKEHWVSVEKDQEIQVNDITHHLIQQLSHEAFNTVHSLWKTRKEVGLLEKATIEEEIEEEAKEEVVHEKEATLEDKEKHVKDKPAKLTKEEKIDLVTDQLLSLLLNSEVDIIRNIKQGKTSKLQETRDRKDSPSKPRTSFSSEPLALVPSTHNSICRITECAWNMLRNCKEDEMDTVTPPDHLIEALCDKSGVMHDCEKAFIHLVFQLAVELQNSSTPPSSTSTLASALSTHVLSLEQLQRRVFTHLHRKKGSLPSLRYIQDNRRPGGKEIDYVDCLLIKELRDEEPGWIDYSEDEEIVKIQTADEILDLLIDETVDILNKISLKRSKVFKQ